MHHRAVTWRDPYWVNRRRSVAPAIAPV